MALATADDAGAGRDGHGPGHGAGHHGSAQLAEELGVSEDALSEALDEIRGDLRAERRETTEGERPAPPGEGERGERHAAFAQALADELGLEAAEVTAALDALREERANAGRDALAERLDAAVEAGDLTTADKESVLKAYDAGVFGAGHRGAGGHGGPGGHGGMRS